MDIDNLEKLLRNEELKSVITSILIDDKSLEFEDILSECFLEFNNKKTLSKNELVLFLRNFYSNSRKHKSVSFISDIGTYEIGEEIEELDYLQNNKNLIEKCSQINLINEEVLCLLYMHDKSNLKRFDYKFLLRNDSKSVNKVELSKYYESIIKKLLKFTQESVCGVNV